MLRGRDLSELEIDLAKVEQYLKSFQDDDTSSPSERELRRLYYGHWQKRLRFLLAKRRGSFDQIGYQVKEGAQSSLNEVEVSDESWKIITPPRLLRAVINIRKDFETLCDAQRDYFGEKCFNDLHPLTSGMTEPAVFKNYFYACIGRLQEIVKYSFGRFLEISLKQKGLIGAAPVEWASLQTVDLIEREDRTIEGWIKSVCDKTGNVAPETKQEFMENIVFRTDWRAPGWLYMQPNGNAAYNASTAWERRSERDTRQALRHLRENRWLLSLESTLADLVGITHEILAKRRSAPESEPQSRAQSSAPAATKEDQSRKTLTKPLMLSYRSGIKLAILGPSRRIRERRTLKFAVFLTPTAARSCQLAGGIERKIAYSSPRIGIRGQSERSRLRLARYGATCETEASCISPITPQNRRTLHSPLTLHYRIAAMAWPPRLLSRPADYQG